MRDILRNWFTGIDGITHDLGRVIGALTALVGLGLEVYAVVWGKSFDFQAYGIGVGALATGIGAMLKLKESTEPPRTPGPER